MLQDFPISNFPSAKMAAILKEILPDVKRANVLFNPDTAPGCGPDLSSFDRSRRENSRHRGQCGTRPQRLDIEAIFTSISRSQGAGAIIPPDIFLVVNRASIIELAARYRVPTIYQYDYFVETADWYPTGSCAGLVSARRRLCRSCPQWSDGQQTFPSSRRSSSSLSSTSRPPSHSASQCRPRCSPKLTM